MAIKRQRTSESIEDLEKAARIFRDVGRKYELAKVLLSISQALLSLNRESDAKQTLNEAEQIFKELNTKRDLERSSELKKRMRSGS